MPLSSTIRKDNFDISELIALLVEGFNHDEPDLIMQFMDDLEEQESSLFDRRSPNLRAMLVQSMMERQAYVRLSKAVKLIESAKASSVCAEASENGMDIHTKEFLRSAIIIEWTGPIAMTTVVPQIVS